MTPIRPMKKKCSSGHQDGEACGESLTEIPYRMKDDTTTGYVSICKKCDCYPEWPRAK